MGARTQRLRAFAARCYLVWMGLMPKVLLSKLMFHVARIQADAFKNALIGWFVRRYGVNLSEATLERVGSYPDFASFFARKLKPDARKIDPDAKNLISPVDGRISQAGPIQSGTLIQAKGFDYSVEDLLGSTTLAPLFQDGHFCTLYLAPRDYHRVHMPLTGKLRAWSYQPGTLFPVNDYAAQIVPRLFVRNERVGAVFDTDYGPVGVVMVGAMLVGSIETVWAGRVTPPHNHEAGEYAPMSPVVLLRAREMGHFNMGSTVVLLTPRGMLTPRPFVKAGTPVRMGLGLGKLSPVGSG